METNAFNSYFDQMRWSMTLYSLKENNATLNVTRGPLGPWVAHLSVVQCCYKYRPVN